VVREAVLAVSVTSVARGDIESMYSGVSELSRMELSGGRI
jgi:hypothetical protein